MKSYPLSKANTLQNLIQTLNQYWSEQGCLLLQPSDSRVSSGLFHPSTFMKSIGPELWQMAYVQPCRRPQDSRYNKSTSTHQCFHQFQVLLKPSPENMQQLYLESLKALGIDTSIQEVRFSVSDWNCPPLDIWATGWKVYLNGSSISRLSYLQKVGGLDCYPIPGCISYGIERLAMHLQGVESINDVIWSINAQGLTVTYNDVMQQAEVENSQYYFELTNTSQIIEHIHQVIEEGKALAAQGLIDPSYSAVLKISHLVDVAATRQALSNKEQKHYQQEARAISRLIAKAYYQQREQLHFPLAPNSLITGQSITENTTNLPSKQREL